MLRIKLVKSAAGNTPRNRRTVESLGLRRTGAVIYQQNTPEIRGMIHHVKHLLEVTEVEKAPDLRLRPTKEKALARKAANRAKKPAAAAKPKAEPKAEAKPKAEKAAAPKKPAAKKATKKEAAE